jgi:hypothetical protein
LPKGGKAWTILTYFHIPSNTVAPLYQERRHCKYIPYPFPIVHKEIRSLLSHWFSGAWKINRGYNGDFKSFPCFPIGLSDALKYKHAKLLTRKAALFHPIGCQLHGKYGWAREGDSTVSRVH